MLAALATPRAPSQPKPDPQRPPHAKETHQNPSQHARLACVACNKSTHTPTLITAAAARACSVPPVHTRTRLSRACRVRRLPVLRAAHPVRLRGGGGGRHWQPAGCRLATIGCPNGLAVALAAAGARGLGKWPRAAPILAREACVCGGGASRYAATGARRTVSRAAMRMAGGGRPVELCAVVPAHQPFSTASAREPPARMAGVQSMLAVRGVSACMLHVGISIK